MIVVPALPLPVAVPPSSLPPQPMLSWRCALGPWRPKTFGRFGTFTPDFPTEAWRCTRLQPAQVTCQGPWWRNEGHIAPRRGRVESQGNPPPTLSTAVPLPWNSRIALGPILDSAQESSRQVCLKRSLPTILPVILPSAISSSHRPSHEATYCCVSLFLDSLTLLYNYPTYWRLCWTISLLISPLNSWNI